MRAPARKRAGKMKISSRLCFLRACTSSQLCHGSIKWCLHCSDLALLCDFQGLQAREKCLEEGWEANQCK